MKVDKCVQVSFYCVHYSGMAEYHRLHGGHQFVSHPPGDVACHLVVATAASGPATAVTKHPGVPHFASAAEAVHMVHHHRHRLVGQKATTPLHRHTHCSQHPVLPSGENISTS